MRPRSAAFALLALVAVCPPALGGEGVVDIWSSEPVADWVLDAASGRVLASQPESSQVVEFDPETGAELRVFDLPGEPGQLIVKGRRLVVALRSEPGLIVINLDGNEIEGHVALAGRGAHALFASQVENSWVWAVCRTDDAGLEAEVFGVHLESLAVQRRISVDSWSQSSLEHVAMSADGCWVVADARGVRSPGGADLMVVDEELGRFEDRRHLHESFGEIVAGPLGRLWSLGRGLYSRDLSQKLRELPGSPVAIHSRLDVVASVVRRQAADSSVGMAIVLESLSAGIPLAEVPLASSEDVEGGVLIPRELGGRDDPVLAFDAGRGRLFHGWGQQGHVIDLRALGLEVDPLPRIVLPAQAQVVLGSLWRGEIGANDAEWLSRAEISLEHGPPGMEVSERQLAWTPDAESVGRWDVTVLAREEGYVDQAVISLEVTYPAIELGGEASGLAVDEVGHQALVWSDVSRVAGPGGEPVELAVVELEAFVVVARKAMDENPRAAVISSGVVYLLGARGDEVVTLAAADLSVLARTPLTVVADSLLALEAGGVIAVGAAGEVALASDGVRQLWSIESSAWGNVDRGVMAATLSRGVLVGPRVLSSPGLQLDMLLWPQRLLAWPRLEAKPVLPALWSRQVTTLGMSGAKGSTARWTADRVQLLRTMPVAVTAEIQPAEKGSTLLLSWWDLVHEEPRHAQVVSSSLVGDADHASGLHLAAAGDAVVVTQGSRLHLVASPGAKLVDLPDPLQIVPRVAPTVWGVADKGQIQLHAHGGRGDYRFSLRSDVAGLSLDEKTGVVSVDAAAIWQRAQGEVSVEVDRWRLAEEDRAAAIARLQDSYGALTGEATVEQLPLSVPLDVEVRDASGQVDRLVAALIVLGPISDLAVVERAGDTEPEPALAGQGGQRGEASGLEALGMRLEALEARLSDLPRRLDTAVAANEKASRATTEPLAYGLARTAQQLGTLDKRLSALSRRLETLEEARGLGQLTGSGRLRSLLMGMMAAAAIMGSVLPRTGYRGS